MVKINYSLLPVKTHYFFFMAAMGPILPFLPVMGKQLGVTEVVMGLLLSVIPILFFLAKPLFGFILDYFQSQRKTVFISLIVATTLFFSLLRLTLVPKKLPFNQTVACTTIQQCLDTDSDTISFSGASTCQMTWDKDTPAVRISKTNDSFCSLTMVNCSSTPDLVEIHCDTGGIFTELVFWGFVATFTLGSMGYNVANSVSDAICFDVLGSGNEKNYGKQRVWGTVGFGLSALLGGYCVDLWSGPVYKDYTPAFLIAIMFTSIDLLCCTKLKLPTLPKSQNILKDVSSLVRDPSIATFLLFAAFQGICESFIIFFMFWYLEDLAAANGMMHNIKLLQGLTVAAETLIGEVIFFPLSGRILKAVGFRNCLSLCFLAYTLRLGLLSLISNPWWALGIELLQGPSYALSYTTVVAYASAISPPGTSATMQGIAAGVDDGFGYSAGSLIGGLLYRSLGGSLAFRVFSGFALTCSISHWLIYVLFFKENAITTSSTVKQQKSEKRNIYNPPREATELVETAS